MSAGLATAVQTQLELLFGSPKRGTPSEPVDGAKEVPAGDGNKFFERIGETVGPAVTPVVAQLGEGDQAAVGFSLTELPRTPTMGGVSRFRELQLAVTVAARDYETLVIAGEFLAAFIGISAGAGDAAFAVDEDGGETGQELDDDGVYSAGRSFTLIV